jgi:hypothetical protein
MRLWSMALPLQTYHAYLDKGVNILTELTHTERDEHDEALAAYYNLAQETNPDFEEY